MFSFFTLSLGIVIPSIPQQNWPAKIEWYFDSGWQKSIDPLMLVICSFIPSSLKMLYGVALKSYLNSTLPIAVGLDAARRSIPSFVYFTLDNVSKLFIWSIRSRFTPEASNLRWARHSNSFSINHHRMWLFERFSKRLLKVPLQWSWIITFRLGKWRMLRQWETCRRRRGCWWTGAATRLDG